MEIIKHLELILENVYRPVVLEFGACDGYHSNLMLQVIKKTERPFVFHTFEPNLSLHPQIIKNLAAHIPFNTGIISLFPNAVGEENEVRTFYKSHGQRLDGKGHVTDNYYGSSSVRKPTEAMLKDFPGMKFTEEEVSVITLDTHLEKYGLHSAPIDFIWADIQGNENALIAGGHKAFKRVRYFYTEYSKDGAEYEGQATYEELRAMLPDFDVVHDYGGDVLLKNRYLAI